MISKERTLLIIFFCIVVLIMVLLITITTILFKKKERIDDFAIKYLSGRNSYDRVLKATYKDIRITNIVDINLYCSLVLRIVRSHRICGSDEMIVPLPFDILSNNYDKVKTLISWINFEKFQEEWVLLVCLNSNNVLDHSTLEEIGKMVPKVLVNCDEKG